MSSDLWSEEYDSMPLGLRFKMLHSNRFRNDSCDNTPNTPTIADIGNSTQQASDYVSSLHSLDFDMTRVDASLHQITSHVSGNVLQDCLLGSGSGFSSSSSSSSVNMLASHLKLDDFDDSLDTVMLGERRKLLLSRKLIQYSKLDTVDQNDGNISNSSRVMLHKSENDSNRDALISEHANEVNVSDNVALGNAFDATSQIPKKRSEPMPLSSVISTKSRSLLLSEKGKSCGTEEPDIMDPPAAASSVLPLLVKVKNEPLEIDEFCSEGKNIMQNSFVGPTLSVKKEPELSEYPVDELDHMSLANRLSLLSSGIPSLEVSGNPVLVNEDVASGLDFGNDVLESVKPISISRPRKKRRTATDSVETALEEDAPGLLKVLLERGVSAEEIKLYGEEDGDDALDDSFGGDGFAELEAVISQLFSQRQTFLKFPLLRTKGAKVNYCLSCLLSLVEQTKYLRSRKWPVEWGWCRDLQSFIFVFQRHNRIVLERPEYGYATYFFELLNSVPVAWQIKRLVTAMKLTSCGRITVIENRPLLVGEDLSEGEAKVLAEYGWTPNTGLGTMLNYCDRVVHDRKQELDSSEWRMKIGKQLMNGYNGGNLVAANLPKRLTECRDFQNVQVKLEEE